MVIMSGEALINGPISLQKEALSGDMIELNVSEDANKALQDRGLELGATYEIWKNTGGNQAEATVKIEGLSGGPSGEGGSWVEERIVKGGNNISIWTSENDGKIGNMGYLNDFSKDPRGGSITTINGTKFYFEKVEDNSAKDQAMDIISI